MRLPKAFPCAPLNRFQERKDCKSLACVRLGLAFFRDLFDRTEPRRSSAQACGSSAQVQPSRLRDPGHAAICASHDCAQAVGSVLAGQRGLDESTVSVVVGLFGADRRQERVGPALKLVPKTYGWLPGRN